MVIGPKAFLHPKSGNIVSPKGRILWNSVFNARKKRGGDKDKPGKYEFNLLFPKAADHTVTREAALEAGKDKHSKLFKDAAGKWPSTVKNPFKRTADNDKLVAALEEADMKVEDWPVYYAARTTEKPQIAGPNGKVAGVEAEHVYSGRWAVMTHDCYAGDFEGNKYVSFGLKNIQLLDNDDELVVGGGRVSAESEFEAADGAGEDGKSTDQLFD